MCQVHRVRSLGTRGHVFLEIMHQATARDSQLGPAKAAKAYVDAQADCVLMPLHRRGLTRRFYGDLQAEAAARGDDAQGGLAMAVLRRLFAVEGEQLLEEMLSAVLGTADPDQQSGQGPDAPEPASWAKVLKVPASCQPHAPSAAKAEHPCTSHDVVTVGDAIESRDSGESSKPSVLQLAVSSAPVPVPERSGCGAGPSQVPQAVASPGSSLSQAASLGSMPASRLWRQSTGATVGAGRRGATAMLPLAQLAVRGLGQTAFALHFTHKLQRTLMSRSHDHVQMSRLK